MGATESNPTQELSEACFRYADFLTAGNWASDDDWAVNAKQRREQKFDGVHEGQEFVRLILTKQVFDAEKIENDPFFAEYMVTETTKTDLLPHELSDAMQSVLREEYAERAAHGGGPQAGSFMTWVGSLLVRKERVRYLIDSDGDVTDVWFRSHLVVNGVPFKLVDFSHEPGMLDGQEGWDAIDYADPSIIDHRPLTSVLDDFIITADVQSVDSLAREFFEREAQRTRIEDEILTSETYATGALAVLYAMRPGLIR